MKITYFFIFLEKFVSGENPFFYLWIGSSLISSCYAYTWDIKLDWGLFDAKAGDNKFLREEIVYSSTVSAFLYFSLTYRSTGLVRTHWVRAVSTQNPTVTLITKLKNVTVVLILIYLKNICHTDSF